MITERQASYVFPFVIYLLPPIAVFAPNGVVPLGALGAAVLLLAGPVRQCLWARLRAPLAAGLAVLLAWQAAASAWSPDPPESLVLVFRIALIFGGGLVYFAALDGLDADGRRRASTALAWAGPIYLVLLGGEVISGGMVHKLGRGIPLSEPFNFNYLNRSSVILAILAWPIAIAIWRRAGAVAGVLFLFLAFAFVWELPILAAAVGYIAAGAAFVAAWFRPRATMVVLGVVIASVLVLGPPIATLGFTETSHLAGMRDLAEELPHWATSGQHRLLIAKFVLEQIVEHPWLGWGFDASRDMHAGMFEELVKGSRIPLHPHNAALQIWLELGVVGVVITAGVIVHTLRSALRFAATSRAAAVAAASFAGYTVIALLSFGIWQNWWLVTVWFAAILAMLPMIEERTTTSAPGSPPGR